jgi:hypothetical protein
MIGGRMCENCAAYSALTNECRRNAPKAMPIQSAEGPSVIGVFPATSKTSWCAEWLADQTPALQ